MLQVRSESSFSHPQSADAPFAAYPSKELPQFWKVFLAEKHQSIVTCGLTGANEVLVRASAASLMMVFTWFWLVAIVIGGYVVLDGFDLGIKLAGAAQAGWEKRHGGAFNPQWGTQSAHWCLLDQVLSGFERVLLIRACQRLWLPCDTEGNR